MFRNSESKSSLFVTFVTKSSHTFKSMFKYDVINPTQMPIVVNRRGCSNLENILDTSKLPLVLFVELSIKAH